MPTPASACTERGVAPRSVRRGKELVGRRVAHSRLLGEARGIAGRARRDPAPGFDPADECDGGERTAPLMAFRPQQQPGDRVLGRRVGAGGDLADDGGAVTRLPGRAGEMRPDLAAIAVEESGLGRFDDPGVAPILFT
jgi:hypothetical protein